MSGRIIFMTEEPSMGHALRILLPKVCPDFREFEHWLILNHQGKSDLEQSYPKKMANWQEPGIKFIILRDNDGSDCRNLKKRLVSIVPSGTHEFQIRIVCQELESWFLGDMQAVIEAYPRAKRNPHFNHISKQDPDQLTNASDLIKQLTGTGAKILRAEAIARRMQLAENRSTSFHVFILGLRKFITD